MDHLKRNNFDGLLFVFVFVFGVVLLLMVKTYKPSFIGPDDFNIHKDGITESTSLNEGYVTTFDTLDLGADDCTSNLAIHDNGTIIMYDDSDGTVVTLIGFSIDSDETVSVDTRY